jgi:hypothetical protein
VDVGSARSGLLQPFLHVLDQLSPGVARKNFSPWLWRPRKQRLLWFGRRSNNPEQQLYEAPNVSLTLPISFPATPCVL